MSHEDGNMKLAVASEGPRPNNSFKPKPLHGSAVSGVRPLYTLDVR